MTFTNYTYYKTKYCGTLVPELRFPYYASKASAVVNAETFGRAKKVVDEAILPILYEIQECVCYIAEALYRKDEAPQIASHSAGGESIIYAVDNSSTKNDIIREALVLYLPPELLYRGI